MNWFRLVLCLVAVAVYVVIRPLSSKDSAATTALPSPAVSVGSSPAASLEPLATPAVSSDGGTR